MFSASSTAYPATCIPEVARLGRTLRLASLAPRLSRLTTGFTDLILELPSPVAAVVRTDGEVRADARAKTTPDSTLVRVISRVGLSGTLPRWIAHIAAA